MESKELKIEIPKGYEIDKDNSTFECIRFKLIKKDIIYKDVHNSMLKTGYHTDNRGKIMYITKYPNAAKIDKNNATNEKQLKRLLALNQLLNIAKYYNKKHSDNTNPCTIVYCNQTKKYNPTFTDNVYTYGVRAFFNSEEDAQAVIDNPNFQEILDTIYKD